MNRHTVDGMSPVSTVTRLLAMFAGVCATFGVVTGFVTGERWPMLFAVALFLVGAVMFLIGEMLDR